MRPLPAAALLVLALVLHALPPAQAHVVRCEAPYVHCLAECLGDHAGTPPPHLCGVGAPGDVVSDPIRYERCPESDSYATFVFGVQVSYCLH